MISQSLSKYINVNGRLLDLSIPQVMGVLNVTPDSFYSGCRAQTDEAIAERARQILEEGASIIDIGAYSSRPNCVDISPEEELSRLQYALKILNEVHPDAIISVDTFRASVAEVCVKEYGVAIINDISGGEMDKNMFDTVINLQVPYIMQHMQGTPQNMQNSPHYDNLMRETFLYFSEKIQSLHDRGLNDIILDPGFGFGKTLDHNYELLSHLDEFKIFELPILVGLSRKSMITKLLDVPTTEALNGTSVANTIALMKGADIIRVHDVKEAVQAVKIVQKCRNL